MKILKRPSCSTYGWQKHNVRVRLSHSVFLDLYSSKSSVALEFFKKKQQKRKTEPNQTEETTNLKFMEGVRFDSRLSIIFNFVLFSPQLWARKPYVPPMPAHALGRRQEAFLAVLLRCVLEAGSPRTCLPDAQRRARWGLKPSIFFQSETGLSFGEFHINSYN